VPQHSTILSLVLGLAPIYDLNAPLDDMEVNLDLGEDAHAA
jgi:hypothetical protein